MNSKPYNRKDDRARKRKAQELETESSVKSNSLLRQSNRSKRRTKSKEFSDLRQGDHLGRCRKKKKKKS